MRITAQMLPLILLIGAEVCFGATFSITRLAMDEGIPFFAFTFWASFGAVVLLFPVILARREFPRLTKNHLLFYLASGIFGLAFPYTMLAIVAPNTPPAVLSLVITLAPILTYIIAIILKLDRLAYIRVVGIAAGGGGVLCILLPETSLLESSALIWMIIALTVPFSFAIMAILAALIRPSDAGSYDSAFALLVVATIIMIPIMAATGQLWMFSGSMSVGDWALIIYMVINAGFYVVLYEVVRLAGPVFFSSGNFIATLSGVIWAILVFGEIPSYWIWVALVLLSLGLFLVNRSNVQQSKRDD